MSGTQDVFKEFRSMQADKLFELIKSRGLLDNESAEAVIHALIDISESIEKIYFELVPGTLTASNSNEDNLKDKLWEIREEFRHIEYHLEDAKLTEL